LKWGIPADRIKVIGIPVEPVFTRRLEKKKILEEMGFEDGVFSILAIGGGYGVGPIEVIAKTAMTLPEKVQLIVICGHNVNLKERIERLSSSSKIKMKVLGFVDNVYYFMEAADVLISKSGGITVAESLVKDLPMIVISPIIGQETNNCEFLTSRGAAVKVNEIADLKAALEDMVSNPEKVAAMKEAVRKIGAPNASHDIARLALEAVRDE
jgi:processive 1,2-diacylglycerol beta-glucosyltransferase